ncbi:MAG: hypothetical protein HQK66_04925 [Desulfamplus sp.]|nr:hypothetical protein [Desulfamplus sp.]
MEQGIDSFTAKAGAFVFLLFLLLHITCHKGLADDNLPVAVLVSQEIKPFIEMVEGLESHLDGPVVRIFMDHGKNPFSHDPLYKGMDMGHYSYMVAVGPWALSLLVDSELVDSELVDSDLKLQSRILYAMVLSPEKIIPPGISICGISLNLFSRDALSKIPRVLPSVKKIGVLFDPGNNEQWFLGAKAMGLFSNMEAIPLHIETQSDINTLYRQGFMDVDALMFIPDSTLASPTIIKYVIKQAIALGIPVIGYNSFFHQSGAALSFVLDYADIGREMARNINSLAKNGECLQSMPPHNIMINERVLELLGLETNHGEVNGNKDEKREHPGGKP